MIDEQLLEQLVLSFFSGSIGYIVALLATLILVAVTASRGPGGRA